MGNRRAAAARCADGEGRHQPAALPVAPWAAQGEEERDRADQAAVAGWRIGKDPTQVAGAGAAHGRDSWQERRCRRASGRTLPAPEVALSMVLTFIEHVNGAPTMLSLELLTMAGRLAHQMNAPFEAVAIGAVGTGAAGALSSYGVSTLHVADDPRLADYAPSAWAHAVAEL